jgi:hypothetical protein
VINTVRDDHNTSVIPHLIEREQDREQMRLSDGIADEKAAQITDYQVQMVGLGRTDVVFSLDGIDNNAPPSVLWAGDLDADGVVDLFADLPTHYAGHHYILFLSSVARAGQLVAEAASLTTVGC